jgi:transposase InsO family protein
MEIASGVLSGISRIAKTGVELSREGTKRLKWFDYYYAHDKNARLTCRHFDISPQTFYRWKRRYDKSRLQSLESRSHRPKRVRQPMYSGELVEAVVGIREQYPRWGKDKLLVLLQTQGFQTSASTVGRILTYARKRGILKEPRPNYVSAAKRMRQRPHATRKPQDYQVKQAGDVVQLDTLDLRPLPGVILKHFTAHDVICKWNVLDVYHQATAANAAKFVDTIEARMPFSVKSLQVDGGSEFQAVFEEVCRTRGIKLFVLPPRSPKLNGGVERAHRTHTEEFYEVTDSTFELDEIRSLLLKWETTYNTLRPHQALGYLTPARFLEKTRRGGQVSIIT